MKKYLLVILFLFFSSSALFAQQKLLSYDDVKYLLHINLNSADTFLIAKGYTLQKKDDKKKTRKYTLATTSGSYVNLTNRTDGRRVFMELETNEPGQYNLIYNSIAQYVDAQASAPDMQAFKVKDLGMIYVMVNDVTPYNPLRRLYTIQIASEAGITSYD